jgi:hypothetical protein
MKYKRVVWGYYLRKLFKRPYKNTINVEQLKEKFFK